MENTKQLYIQTETEMNNLWFDEIYKLSNEIIKECCNTKNKIDIPKIIDIAKQIKVFTY